MLSLCFTVGMLQVGLPASLPRAQGAENEVEEQHSWRLVASTPGTQALGRRVPGRAPRDAQGCAHLWGALASSVTEAQLSGHQRRR